MELCVYPSKTVFILLFSFYAVVGLKLETSGFSFLRSPLGGQAPPLPISL